MGRAYLPVIFELMDWNVDWPYYIQGECLGNGKDSFLLFDLKDAEGVIQQRNMVKVIETEKSNPNAATDTAIPMKAMPQEWLTSFGTDYYSPSTIQPQGKWNAQATGKPTPRNDPFNATSEAELREGINTIIATITEGSAGND